MLTSSTRFLAVSLIGAWALTLGTLPALAATSPARPDSTWVALGALPERLDGPVFALALNPGDSTSILVGTSSGSIYRSADGGTSWTTGVRGLGRGVLTIQFSPFKPGLVYAGTRSDGLYRSVDGGVTWAKQPAIPNTTVRSVGFAKSITLVGADGGLFSSRDGVSWTPFPTLAPLSLSAIAVPVVNDPTPRFLAGGDATRANEALPLYVSPDAGVTWTNVKSLGSSTMIGTAAAGPAPIKGDSRALVVGTNVGAFLSNDGGVTWAQIAGLPAIDFTSVTFLANHPERFYVASDGGGSESGGLWTTSDAGQSFRSLGSPIGSVTALAISSEDLPTVYTATYRPIDHAVMLWAYHDTGATPNPPAGGLPPAAGIAAAAPPVAIRAWDWRRWATGPEAPFLALGALSLLVLLSAVVLQFRRGSD